MAKFELKFLDVEYPPKSILVEAVLIENQIFIEIQNGANQQNISIYLDKSTAIKFAKTLRTEINKIKEGENNG